MDIAKLKIGHKVKNNGKTVISCSFTNIEANKHLIENQIDFKKEWINKKVFFINKNIEANIKGIEVSSNIIGYKTVHFMLNSNFFEIAQEGDIVKITS